LLFHQETQRFWGFQNFLNILGVWAIARLPPVCWPSARQWLLIPVNHVVLYCVKRSMSEKISFLTTKHNICDCCRSIGYFLCGVDRVKSFTNVYLHCIVRNLKKIRKMSTLPPWKNICGRPWLPPRTTATQDNRLPGQLSPRMKRYTHHSRAINLLYNIALRQVGVLATRRLGTTVLRYFFNIAQQNWAATLLLLPYNSQIKSWGKAMHRTWNARK